MTATVTINGKQVNVSSKASTENIEVVKVEITSYKKIRQVEFAPEVPFNEWQSILQQICDEAISKPETLESAKVSMDNGMIKIDTQYSSLGLSLLFA